MYFLSEEGLSDSINKVKISKEESVQRHLKGENQVYIKRTILTPKSYTENWTQV